MAKANTSTSTSTSTSTTSIWNRKLDLLYLVFMVIHVPVMFCVDLAVYYPVAFQPEFTVLIREYYVRTYRDRFFISPPAWFYVYSALEAVYQVPLTIWAIWALVKDHPMVPLQLLVFAVLIAVSTLTCVAEMLSWEGYTPEEQTRLAGLYLPYLGLLDMFFRLRTIILRADATNSVKKLN